MKKNPRNAFCKYIVHITIDKIQNCMLNSSIDALHYGDNLNFWGIYYFIYYFLYPFPLAKGYTNFGHKGLKYKKYSR